MQSAGTLGQADANHGWRIVGAAFVLAVFGWGVGFYGPPVFLNAVREARGWSLAFVSAAATVHFLMGAVSAANLPTYYRILGGRWVTRLGALCLGVGICGWAAAVEPWQLIVAALVSGCGWGTLNAAALNIIISPWFVRHRPAALAMAYNGGSVGGVIFSPLWAVAIEAWGFRVAVAAIGAAMALVVWMLAFPLFRRRQETQAHSTPLAPAGIARLPGRLMWLDRGFLTLSAAMALGLFAQVGVLSQLYMLLQQPLGAGPAGLVISMITVAAIAGRLLLGWLMPANADRRLIACACYGTQLAGSILLVASSGTHFTLLLPGLLLFGIGFGNVTLLPPLIAQVEFAEEDVGRVVALVLAIAQAAFAFGPAAFGLIQSLAGSASGLPTSGAWVFAAAAVCQTLAIGALLAGHAYLRPRTADIR